MKVSVPMKRLLIVFLALLASLITQQINATENQEDSVALFPVQVNGMWGYIDKAGKLFIKPQFDKAQRFCNGLAQVTVDGKIGYIDKTGKYVWEPTK